MEKEEFTKIRERLGFSRLEFGRLLNYAQPYLRVWEIELGKMPISPQISRIVELLAENERLAKFEAKQKNMA